VVFGFPTDVVFAALPVSYCDRYRPWLLLRFRLPTAIASARLAWDYIFYFH
jgi:hypothetical protein